MLIFERLWQELGLEELLRELARRGRQDFDVERCAFALGIGPVNPSSAVEVST